MNEDSPQRRRGRREFIVLIIFLIFGLWGCPQKKPELEAKPGTLPPYKFAVAEAIVTRSAVCPVCLRPVFNCELKDGAAQEFEDGLSGALSEKGLGMVKLSLAQASAADKKRPENWLPLAQGVKADYLLLPVIYCFSERQGSAVASSRPAQVGFHWHIYETATGKEVWGGNFNEQQAPLSANLLEFNQFLQRHGAWITADKLGREGSEKLLGEFLKVMAENAADPGH